MEFHLIVLHCCCDFKVLSVAQYGSILCWIAPLLAAGLHGILAVWKYLSIGMVDAFHICKKKKKLSSKERGITKKKRNDFMGYKNNVLYMSYLSTGHSRTRTGSLWCCRNIQSSCNFLLCDREKKWGHFSGRWFTTYPGENRASCEKKLQNMQQHVEDGTLT